MKQVYHSFLKLQELWLFLKHLGGFCIMAMERKNNKIVTECITIALIQLMEKKNFDDISITELTKRAGVGRVSFYRNFEDKKDVLRKYLNDIQYEFMISREANRHDSNFTEYITDLFTHLYNYKELGLLLLKADMFYLVKEQFDYVFDRLKTTRKEEAALLFLSGGLYNAFYYWVSNNYAGSPKEIAESITQYISVKNLIVIK